MNDLNQGFPSGPSSERDDLLTQISARDEKDSFGHKQKSKHSIVMEFVVLFMKITFILDDAKRKNQKLFDTLNMCWGAFLSLVYLSGLGMLFLLMYSYTQFPEVVKQSLIHQGIVVKEYQIKSYSLSKVELHDLEDKNGTYSIKKMLIHSTFSDFIKRRVKSVVLDGVRIKIKETKNGLELGALPQALLDINQSPITRKVKVDSLSLTNAVLEINGKDYNLPVSFSLTGVYEKDSKISIPLFIKEKNANIIGALSITGNESDMNFVLKITSGTLTLPQRSPENITGEVSVTTRKMVIEKAAGKFDLSYGRSSKKIEFDFAKGREELYKGSVDLAFANLDSLDKTKEVKSSMSLAFDGLFIKSLHEFGTVKPIKVVVQSFQKQDVMISNVSAVLNGELKCNNQICFYRVRQFSPVFVKESSAVFNSNVIKSNDEYSFSLAPNNSDTLVWKKNTLSYNVKIERAAFSGYKNTRVSPISVSAGTIGIKGYYDVANVKQKLAIDVQKLAAVTPELSLSNTSFQNEDLFDENAHIQVFSDKIELADNDIFKAPFRLTMDKKGLDTKAVLGMDNNMIQISFSGLSRLLTGEFKGNVFLHPVELEQLNIPLSQISSLFPEGIEQPTGQLSGLGSVYWKNSKQIMGPFYVSFRDVGFKVKDVSVAGLNTVLSLQTIAPLITPNNQKVFIEAISGAVPLQNILLDLKVESQFVKLSAATAFFAGIPMQADAALIATKSSAFTLFFRNSAVDWAASNKYLKLSGALLSGKGSILFPVEMREGDLSIKNAEAKITNGDLRVDKASPPLFAQNFGMASSFFIRTGSVFLNSAGTGDKANITLSLEGRLLPNQQIKNIKESFEESLGKIVSPMAPQSVPAEIVKKQNIISK